MALSWEDVTGNGNWELVDASYNEPVSANTAAVNIAQQSQATTGGLGDGWGGFFQSAGKLLLTGYVAKETAQTSAQLQAQRMQAGQVTPIYSTSGGGLGINMNMLLIVGAVVGVILLVKD